MRAWQRRYLQYATHGFMSLSLGGAACGSPSDSEPPPVREPVGPISIRNGDVTISAFIDVPTGPAPYPVMVFVPGSGTGTKADDQPAVGNALQGGVAVVRYDKRGLGQSTGVFEEITVGGANSERVLDVRASDVQAIVDYLAGRSDIRHDRIFLWGTSQGAWVAPLVAQRTSNVAFIINVSGGGSPVGTSDYYDGLADDPTKTIEELTARLREKAAAHPPLGQETRQHGRCRVATEHQTDAQDEHEDNGRHHRTSVTPSNMSAGR